MKKRKLQSVFRPFPVMVALAVILMFGSAISPLSAETVKPGETAASDGEPSVCQADMRLFAYERLRQFRDDINVHFQNKSSTASLLPDAIEMYDQFRDDMNGQFDSYFPDRGFGQSGESTEIQDCLSVLNENLEQARSFLRIKAAGTSSVKQTTALLDKYKAINQQLSVLNKSLLKFKSYMETFANKVPCYIEKNCNAG